MRSTSICRVPLLLLAIVAVGCSNSADQEAVVDESFQDALDESTQRLDDWLEEFRNRKTYKSFDIETLATIPDDKIEQAIVDFVLHRLDSDSDVDERMKSLPEGCRALWLTWVVEGEVSNGGFNQYYWNTGGKYASEAVDSFEFFGALQHAMVMRDANVARSQEAEAIQEYRDENTLEAFSDSYKETALGLFDDKFYALKEDLSALRIAKIREAPKLFVSD